MPLVVLQNQRTASGAEILAGALQESGRALLVGNHTFGKGSVQKVYTLRRDARFKLTVARYLVAGYREIADIGLRPDVPIGRLTLTERGLNYSMEQVQVPEGLAPLFYVERGDGWVPGLEGQSREDYALDLATAILEKTSSAKLRDLVSAASELVADLREEEESMLVAQMALRGVDWGEAEERVESTPFVEAELQFVAERVEAGERTELEVVAWNRSDDPVSQMVAELRSVDRVFDGLQIPLGWMDPGEEVRSTIQIELPAGRTGRDSRVELVLRDGEGRQTTSGEALLSYAGSGLPEVALAVRFEQDGTSSRVAVDVENLSEQKLENLRVRLLHPESAGVELLEYDTSLGSLRPGKKGSSSLALGVDPAAELLPLRVLVEAEGFGRLAEWDVELETDGTQVELDAPHIHVQRLPTSTQAGPVRLQFDLEDDGELESVISYVGGEKFSFTEGGQPNLSLALDVLIDEGPNSVALRVRDNQGLERVRSWVIHGTPASTTTDVDASSED
jgi:carboxyl-terminal processing protease